MHSSTSNFEDAPARRAIWFLLLLVVLVALAVELAARFGVPFVNQNMRRFYDELDRAAALAAKPANQPVPVLLLGNSLTFFDIDLRRFVEQLGPECEVARWAVDDTNYLDWYFGLRRLFRAGSRPRFVVLGATGGHFVSPRVRGHFFAHYILDRRDLFAAAARTSADATSFSAMTLAKASAFYGCREEVYKRVMTWILPRFEGFARSLTQRPTSNRVAPDVSARARAQLSELRDLCAAHGAQLIIWLAPTREKDKYGAAVLASARECGVPILIPAAEHEFARESFRDPIHLKLAAAPVFTSLLSAQLRPLLLSGKEPPAPTPP
ncbi:MAG: hypothetical protein HY043_10225 [Verrucomicrobia bacterium]|nr:hypothetical protein [Verrucomicrobiota bacterium]